MEHMTYEKDEIPVQLPDPPKGIAGISIARRGDGFEVDAMEVTVTADDIMRAGGFGATDDISSPIPVASDCTDFESYLRNVRDLEHLGVNVAGQAAPYKDIPEVHKIDIQGVENVHAPKDGIQVIMYGEASATADEVIRAGGFGAKDDISSFLPVASDFTDFEAHLRNAEDYEDLRKDITRPGLGWNADTK